MKNKLLKFPQALIDEVEAYAETIAPEGERANFSAALRDLVRIGLANAGLCEECGATCSATDTHCADCA